MKGTLLSRLYEGTAVPKARVVDAHVPSVPVGSCGGCNATENRELGSKALLLFDRARSRLPYGKWPTAPQEQPGSKEPRRTELPRLREAQAVLGPAPAGMPGRPRLRWRRGQRAGEPRREISTSSELPRHERKNPADLPAFPWLQSFASPSTKRL